MLQLWVGTTETLGWVLAIVLGVATAWVIAVVVTVIGAVALSRAIEAVEREVQR